MAELGIAERLDQMMAALQDGRLFVVQGHDGSIVTARGLDAEGHEIQLFVSPLTGYEDFGKQFGDAVRTGSGCGVQEVDRDFVIGFMSEK